MGLLAARRLVGRFPLFSAYVAVGIAEFLLTLTLHHLLLVSAVTLQTYRWLTIGVTLVSAVLALLVLFELAEELLLRRSSLAQTLRPILRWAGAALLLIASAVSAWVAEPGIQRVMNVFDTLNFSANLIVLGLLLVLLVFSRALQVPWGSLPAGIALGFGVTASAELAATATMAAFGASSYITTDVVRMSAFMVCTLVWLVYAFLPENMPSINVSLNPAQLESWDRDLQRMVQR